METDLQSFEQESSDTINYGIKIKATFDERISNHVRALKYIEGGYSKKRWVQEAIKEKLLTFKKLDFENLKNDRSLNFTISRYTHDEITKILKTLKKLKIRTSKTDFFIEAILEKLEREESKVKSFFKTLIKAASSEESETFKIK